MIASLRGVLTESLPGACVIECGGVGYLVQVSAHTAQALPSAGREVALRTRQVVREDSVQLFGFAEAEEQKLFDLLIGVSGVGPKVALSFLSALAPDALRRSVVAGDAEALTVVPGVGKKVAQRVVLDLRDKLGGEGELVAEGPIADVREALVSLGLTPAEASEALASVQVDDREVEDLLREALQKAGR